MSSMKHIALAIAVGTAAIGAGFAGWLVASRGAIDIVTTVVKDDVTEPDLDSEDATTAFFYQYVGAMANGVGTNEVRAGWSNDAVDVSGAEYAVLDWQQGGGAVAYGDPVISLLEDGTWALTSWSGQEHPSGAGRMLYGESLCPTMDDSKVIAIGPSAAEGCKDVKSIDGAKTSEVFSVGGSSYVFHMIGGEMYLAHLSDETHSALDLETMCVLEERVTSIEDIGYGDSALVIADDALLLSDSGIAQRKDGTWVLFVKGIAKGVSCMATSLCELCARNIYRATSTDLVTWTPLEEVVTQASVPEAYTDVDGTVRVYWQDFSDTCAAQDLKLGAIAPVSTAYESGALHDLSAPEHVVFKDENFESNKKIHYATNANPVALRTGAVREVFAACIGE
jgi:hypothetical protein